MLQFFLTFQSMWGDEGVWGLMASRDTATHQSDIAGFDNDFILDPKDVAGSHARATELLRRFGLEAERINLGDHMPELGSYRWLTAQQVASFKEAMQRCHYWLITLSDKNAPHYQSMQTESFAMESHVEGSVFQVTLRGRLDTLSAPNLVAAWDQVAEMGGIEAVHLDCSGLSYVSSAGMRAFMIMCKHPDVTQVALSGANDDVREVIETMGFDTILDIRP